MSILLGRRAAKRTAKKRAWSSARSDAGERSEGKRTWRMAPGVDSDFQGRRAELGSKVVRGVAGSIMTPPWVDGGQPHGCPPAWRRPSPVPTQGTATRAPTG